MTLRKPAVKQKVYMVRGNHRIVTRPGSVLYHVQKWDGEAWVRSPDGCGPWDYYANAKHHLRNAVGDETYYGGKGE